MGEAIYLGRMRCLRRIKDISEAIITLTAGDLVYNGAVQTKAVTSVVLDGKTLTPDVDYTISGNSAVNAGSHTIIITGVGKYEGTAQAEWSIAKLSLVKPTISGSFTYSGSAQSCTVSNMNSTYITQSGTASATNAGTYTVEFTLKDTANTQWSDGTTAAVSRTWTIARAAGSISVSPAALSILGPAGTTATATISYTGDGSISVKSSAAGVATVSRSGNTITVKLAASGSATITITLDEGTNYTGASCTIAVTARIAATASTSATSGVTYTSDLSDLSAEDIILFAEAISNNSSITKTTSRVYIDFDDMHYKLCVGDVFTIYTVDEEGIGEYYDLIIIGFNHDTLTTATAYGSLTATGKAGITMQSDSAVGLNPMHSSNTNSCGWTNSVMRTTTVGKLLDPVLPSAWQSIAKPVNKLTSAGNKSTAIDTTSDSYFLLSEIEIFGETVYSVSGEGSQYAYYKAGNSKVNGDRGWWERSPCASSISAFCHVASNGGYSYSSAASLSIPAVIAFCV